MAEGLSTPGRVLLSAEAGEAKPFAMRGFIFQMCNARPMVTPCCGTYLPDEKDIRGELDDQEKIARIETPTIAQNRHERRPRVSLSNKIPFAGIVSYNMGPTVG